MAKALELIEPTLRFLPEVKRPKRRVSFRTKLFWTGMVLTIYFIMCQVPLFGIAERGRLAEFLFMNIIFAARNGTLMQLGIGPIVTAGLIMQLLVGSRLLEIDLSDPHERALFTGAQKLLSIIVTAVEAFVFIIAGFFGPMTPSNQVAVFLQLFAAGIVIILLDEMVQAGWGLGSGVSLFIAAGVSQHVFWGLFSPLAVPERGGEPLGAILAFGHSILRGDVLSSFNRYPFPDMTGFLAMLAVLFIVLYFETVRVEVPVSFTRYGGIRANVPLKFLYVSNIPVILAGALYANLQVISQIVWSKWNPTNTNPILNLLGTFNMTDRGPVPMGGLVYYLSPPRGLIALQSPEGAIHVLIYTVMLCLLCVFFAIAWVESSGMSAKDQAEQLVRAGLQVPGFRQSPKILEKLLQRYVSSLTIISGLFIGLLAAFADLLGAIGSGIGILLTVEILYQYYEIIAREQAMEMYPMLEKILGR
ncbi:MAG: preprotein translocase subunit SecY [Thermoprotei archaeon]|nr:MAG: preprotein translocase subunit SecY [Thermoprotei archaeon]RLF15562.1 MAG: preprotein translocase subunit SecY [Thermoprotei archaeon]